VCDCRRERQKAALADEGPTRGRGEAGVSQERAASAGVLCRNVTTPPPNMCRGGLTP
jgi:hypothetical protein